MDIIRNFQNFSELSLALGFFDGVHKGHVKVISSAVSYARKNGIKSAVVSFAKHPKCYFNGESPRYIHELVYRNKCIADLGVDYLIELDFDNVRQMNADDYLKDIIVKYFSPKAIFTGYNHSFGLNKSGNPNLLKRESKIFGYEYFMVSPEEIENNVISSTRIRNCIKSGEVENIPLMLGRSFFVQGNVEHGRRLGRKLGFPTANIVYPNQLVKLRYGVYFVEVELSDGKFYRGIANFGIKPTVTDEKKELLELNLLDFDGDLYEKCIIVRFIRKLRDEKKFNSLDDLKNQIKIDIEMLKRD